MDFEKLDVDIQDDFIGMEAQLETAMAANDQDEVNRLLKNISFTMRVFQAAATNLSHLCNRVENFKTSGDPDRIISGQNDF